MCKCNILRSAVAGGEDDGEKLGGPPADSDSDSSDSDDAADELRIQALERALQEQLLDYESHVQVSHPLSRAAMPRSLGFCDARIGSSFAMVSTR